MEEIIKMVTETPNDMELGKKIRKWVYTQTEEVNTKWIYESPDGGKTVTKRLFGAPHSEKITIKEDWYKRNEV